MEPLGSWNRKVGLTSQLPSLMKATDLTEKFQCIRLISMKVLDTAASFTKVFQWPKETFCNISPEFCRLTL